MAVDADLPEWSQHALRAAMDQASRQGCIRARLTLVAPRDGGRRSPLRPGWMVAWDIGNHADGHRPDNDAMVVPEEETSIGPGGTAIVRLFPKHPVRWEHVEIGDLLRMRDGLRTVGSATVMERIGPTNEHLIGRWPPFTEVQFLHDFEGVPGGTYGFVIEVHADCYEVEIEGDDGGTTWLGTVPDEYLKRVPEERP